jgi:transketolase
MRDAFIRTLFERASEDKSIVFITGDLGYSVVERFAEELPDQFLNVGVAEQSMIGVAAGLASEGFRCFVYSIANFPTLRCLEQIRNDVCYHNLPVTIVSVGAGVAYGSLGYTHHAVEDLAAMRPLPNITIGSPADPFETIALTNYFALNDGPGYLRLGKNGESNIHNECPTLSLGTPIELLAGDAGLILSTGNVTELAVLAAQDLLDTAGLKMAVWTVPFVKPLFPDVLRDLVSTFPFVVTVEEHVRAGGFGSALLEVFSDHDINIPTRGVSLQESPLTVVGTSSYIRAKRGLTVEKIVETVRGLVG